MVNSARSAASGRFVTRSAAAAAATTASESAVDGLLSEAPARKRARLDPAPPPAATTNARLHRKLHRNHRVPPASSSSSSVATRTLRSRGSPANVEPLNNVGRPPTRFSLTKPRGRVHETINGIRSTLNLHEDEVSPAKDSKQISAELVNDKPPPPSPPPLEFKDKRVLRSQDGGSRSKSDLVHFFPDYEDVVFGPEKEPDVLTVDSTLYITDRKAKTQELPIRQLSSPGKSEDAPHNHRNKSKVNNFIAPPLPKPPPKAPPHQRLDFSPYVKEAEAMDDDPLSDPFYFQAHKRGERKEKQLRNIEKEHAMHEKGDLERLLGELRGPDWLKAMGISGITETEKKSFEPKRDYYLRRVKALLDKFSTWREQEKEMKLKREQALAMQEEQDESDLAVQEDSENEEGVEADDEEPDITVEQSTSSGLDEAALQLQQEAKLFSSPRASKTPNGKDNNLHAVLRPEKSFTSFYEKPYLRTAAIGKHRRGRSVTAFGHPVPEVDEDEFQLPEEYVTEEALTANARKRRRLKRQSKDG